MPDAHAKTSSPSQDNDSRIRERAKEDANVVDGAIVNMQSYLFKKRISVA